MATYLLDSMPLNDYLLGYKRATSLISPWIANKEVATSDICYAEVYELIQSLPNFTSLAVQLQSLVLGPIPAISLDFPIYHRYTQIRRFLRPRNQLIGDMDTLIAAIALEYGLTVVTRDSDFQRVIQLGLKVQGY